MRKLLAVILTMLLSTPMWSQGTTSRVAGVVIDKTGAVVAGATVTAINEGTQVTYTTHSSSTGTFVFDSLQIGTYTVSVDFAGFKKFISKGNVLTIGAPLSVNAVLEVGASSDSIEVHGGAEMVQTETSGNFGTMLDTRSLTQLPVVDIRGRNPLNLVYVVPGVVQSGGQVTGGGVHVHGSRDRAWNFTLDGVDTNETSAGGANFSPTRVNPDSISEFAVITGNQTAEYGRNSGAQVTMVTKSGTNKFHGNAFWFYQSPFLMANDFVNKNAQAIAKTANSRPQFVQNIWGGSVGGPIFKNKTFFFVNLQFLHAINSYSVTNTVFTDSARKGLWRYVIGGRNGAYLSSNAAVDASGNPLAGKTIGTYNMVANDPTGIGLDPAVQKYLGMTPSPNNFTVGDGLNYAGYTFVAPQLEKQVDLTFKIDHNFSPTNAVFFRWASGHQNTFGDRANGGLQAFPGLPNYVDTYRKPRNIAINWRLSPTGTMTNELVLGMNRFGFDFVNPDPNLNSNPPFIFNLVSSPLSAYVNNSRFLTSYQLIDNFTKVKGAHTIKAGINFRYGRHIDHRGSIGSLNAYPLVKFSTSDNAVNLTSFNIPTNINTTFDRGTLLSGVNDLLGRIGRIEQGYVAQDNTTFKPARSFNQMDHRWPEYDFYIQDSWKIRPNVVIDAGLRLEARLAPDFRSYPGLVPDQPFVLGQVPTTTMKFVPGEFFNSDWNNLGPSVGIAWDPWSDGKTSIRANYRIAYDRINTFSFSSTVFQGMPGLTYQLSDTTSGPGGMRAQNWKIPAVPAGVTPEQLRQLPTYGAGSLTVADPNLRTPKVYMWGLSVQREFARRSVLTLTYSGRHGVGLYGGYNANEAQIRSNGFLDAFKAVQAGGESALFDTLLSKYSGSTKLATETYGQFARRVFSSDFSLNNVAGLANTLGNRLQGGVPLVVLDGLSPYFFKPYPQFLGGLNVLETNDYSVYHGFEANFETRFFTDLVYQASWTWSKSQDVRSFDPAFTTVSTGSSQSATATPYNNLNRHLNWGPSDFDRTHVFQTNWVYTLPFGNGKRFAAHANRPLDMLVGGWEVAGNAVYQTGRPITFVTGANTYSSNVQTPVSCTGSCDPYMGKVYFDSTIGSNFYFTSQQKAQLFVPAAGEFSNVGRNFFRQNSTANVNALVAKHFRIREGHDLQMRMEIQNLLNSVYYDTFGSQSIQSSAFTRLILATDAVNHNSARRVQLSMKYSF